MYIATKNARAGDLGNILHDTDTTYSLEHEHINYWQTAFPMHRDMGNQ